MYTDSQETLAFGRVVRARSHDCALAPFSFVPGGRGLVMERLEVVRLLALVYRVSKKARLFAAARFIARSVAFASCRFLAGGRSS